ncbi:MAG: hypothetical protein ABI794_05810 [Betaproteobacteria bacterium]
MSATSIPRVPVRSPAGEGLVLGWFLSRNIHLQFNRIQSRFAAGASDGKALQDRKILYPRLES